MEYRNEIEREIEEKKKAGIMPRTKIESVKWATFCAIWESFLYATGLFVFLLFLSWIYTGEISLTFLVIIGGISFCYFLAAIIAFIIKVKPHLEKLERIKREKEIETVTRKV